MKKLFLIFFLVLLWSTTHAQERNKLYVFIGEKISLDSFDANKKEEISPGVFRTTISLDNAYKAKYKVLKHVYGDFTADTIEFEVYDHYGQPPFSNYKNVLLFVSEHNGKLYHEKYQYFDVYKTKNGSWASPGDPYRFEPEVHKKNIAFKQLEFKKPVTIELVNGRKKEVVNLEQLNMTYKAPHFKLKNAKAIARRGTDIKDLLQVKKEGVLKARGLF
ncbi:hypothetical protein [Rufibacter quisquiliarum]|uniref:GLPGLI family protein n=1 Tax=Rufibacter quisquiliarum TaxID=1549639 RepID=A0A839GIG6_9BACT|nr:hypothetical protein [Rufibacter quisquiliarum]MBA9078662.1 hypothetical protein [Rufibacter quisquiliarum]